MDPERSGFRQTYKRVFAAFTKKTGIKVDYQPVMNFDQQLQSRASTKDLPDVMINDTALMGSFQAQGLLKPIDPASIAGHDEITAKSWSSTVGRDGRHYGIPYSRQAMTLFVRKDWREKLGLPQPKTWQDTLALAKAFATRDPDGDGRKDPYGMVVPGSAQNGYVAWWGASWLWQGGVRIIEKEGNCYRPAMDSAAALRTVTWMKDNLFCGDNGVIQPSAPGALPGSSPGRPSLDGRFQRGGMDVSAGRTDAHGADRCLTGSTFACPLSTGTCPTQTPDRATPSSA